MRLLLAGLLLITATIIPAAEPIRIACVGDSITAGYGLDQAEYYPSVLERLLAGKAVVTNAGRSGATLLKAGDSPYWVTGEFTAATDSKPQIVVIMLGSNDAKPQNWDQHKGEYAKDLAAMVDHFAQLPTRPAVWLCLPPPVIRDNFGIRGDVLKNEIAPLVAKVAKDKDARVIDVFTALVGHPEFFPDGVHPNAEGAALLAATVHAALTAPKQKQR
ncbi:MAG: sialate O-acetylesterase [Planctomycetes bacterium]|nr:sialate O-acetylesterase [Planctomycetota bacterium]